MERFPSASGQRSLIRPAIHRGRTVGVYRSAYASTYRFSKFSNDVIQSLNISMSRPLYNMAQSREQKLRLAFEVAGVHALWKQGRAKVSLGPQYDLSIVFLEEIFQGIRQHYVAETALLDKKSQQLTYDNSIGYGDVRTWVRPTNLARHIVHLSRKLQNRKLKTCGGNTVP